MSFNSCKYSSHVQPITKQNTEDSLIHKLKNILNELKNKNEEIREILDKYKHCDFYSDNEEYIENIINEEKKNMIVTKNMINEFGELILKKYLETELKDNLLLLKRQMTKLLEVEVEKLNQSNTIFNLIKSKRNIDKSNSDSEKLLIDQSLNQKLIKKHKGNVMQIEYLLETAEYRKTSIEQINSNAIYIKKINDDLNKIVSKQTDLVLNIADNIEPAKNNSKETCYNIQELYNKNKSNGSRKCYVIMFVIAFVFFVTMVLINKLR